VRVGYWDASLNIASVHPLGVGVGNYTFYYPRYAPISGRYEFYPGVADSHSWYLDALAETGFLGAALLVVFAFGLPIAALRRRAADGDDHHLVRALAISWLAVAIMHLSYSYFYYPFEWVLAGLVGSAIALRRSSADS
jgi:O-antigen ligase